LNAVPKYLCGEVILFAVYVRNETVVALVVLKDENPGLPTGLMMEVNSSVTLSIPIAFCGRGRLRIF